MTTKSMSITITVQEDFPDDATDDAVRERLGELISQLLDGTDIVWEMVKRADIQTH